MVTKYPTLYKKTSTGALQVWDISARGNTIITAYGQAGGKIQRTEDVLASGKGGRTAEQQARLEAGAKWEKQRKKGYVEDVEQAERGEVNTSVITGGVAPMLAQKFAEHGEKITYPCYVQPKLDGVRCIACIDDGKVTLWTRTRKPITSVPHVVTDLERHFAGKTVVLDGELYVHGMEFEKLVSLVRPLLPVAGSETMQYHVYDMVARAGYQDRVWVLQKIMAGAAGSLRYVETLIAENYSELMTLHARYLGMKYEGSIVRESTTPYEDGKRSYGLQKVKEFSDAEYPIVGVEEGRGRMAGCAIFVCETKDGKRFNCKMEGSIDSLRPYLTDSRKWQGKQLTVRYQNLTKDGIPRFPVGVAVRDYEG